MSGLSYSGWAVLIITSLFLTGPGVILVILAFIAYKVNADQEAKQTKQNQRIYYNPDGSYTVYPAGPVDGIRKPVSAGSVIFSVIKALFMVAVVFAVAYGLLIVGFILLIMVAPDVICGGNSKGCY